MRDTLGTTLRAGTLAIGIVGLAAPAFAQTMTAPPPAPGMAPMAAPGAPPAVAPGGGAISSGASAAGVGGGGGGQGGGGAVSGTQRYETRISPAVDPRANPNVPVTGR